MNIQDCVNDILRGFIGQKLSQITKVTICSEIRSALLDYVSQGMLSMPLPLIDINDEYELEFLRKRRDELLDAIDAIDGLDADDGCNESIDLMQSHIASVRAIESRIQRLVQNDDPNMFRISFKHPVTYQKIILR